jgi:hypothetical protein
MSLYIRNNTLPTVIENDDDDLDSNYNNNHNAANPSNKIKKQTLNLGDSNNNSFEDIENNIKVVDDYDDNYNADEIFDTSNLNNSYFTHDFEMADKLNSKVFDLGLKRGSAVNNRSSAKSLIINNDDASSLNNTTNSDTTNSNETSTTTTSESTIQDDLIDSSKLSILEEIVVEEENVVVESATIPVKDSADIISNKQNIKASFTKPSVKRAKSSVIPKQQQQDTVSICSSTDMKRVLAKRDDVNSKRYLASSQPSLSISSSLGKFESQTRLLTRKQESNSFKTRANSTLKVSLRPATVDTNNINSKTEPTATTTIAQTNLSTPRGSAKLINGKIPITVDTSKANSNLEVVRLCINELGWIEMPNGSPTGCDIYWHSSTYHEGYYGSKFVCNHSGRINKFPCMNQLLRKGPLTQALNVMRYVYPEQYDFYPRTWFLPEQFTDFKTDCKYMHEKQAKMGKPLTTFIVKPNDGSQGEGIYLIKDPNEYLNISSKMMARSYIVQEYIDNPYLIDGLKSDLRIYIVLSSLKPLEIHLCDEGLVRFATVNYETPDDTNRQQVFMHLTNYSLNKKNESYKFTSDGAGGGDATKKDINDQGSKRKLSQMFDQMEKSGIKTKRLKNSIDDLVVKTLFALLPEMKVEYAYEILPACVNNIGPSCFQIFGFDILLTNDLKPMLLEVNCNPSLRIDYEFEDSNGTIIYSYLIYNSNCVI